MKTRAGVVITMTFFLAVVWAPLGICQADNPHDPAVLYAEIIDEYITICNAKAEFLGSGSRVVRKDALRSVLKGSYLMSNRDALVVYLVENGVSTSPPRIRYHLNRYFHDAFQPKEIHAFLKTD